MLEALATVLATMMKDERTFARAEGLYAESFRSYETFTVADDVYPRAHLVQYLMEPIYRPAPRRSMPATMQDDDESDHWAEADSELEILKPGFSQEVAEAMVDSMEFVELCNYKGEGEGGFQLACRVAHLRVFVSKYEYRAA
jgi:hypothetical protein